MGRDHPRRFYFASSFVLLVSLLVTFYVWRYAEQGTGALLVGLVSGALLWGILYSLVLFLAKEMTKRLRRSEEKLRRITDAIPGTVYQYRLESNGRQSFLFVSRGAKDLFGVSAEDLERDFQSGWNLLLTEDVPALQKSIRISAETLKPWVHEFRIKTPAGRIKWIRGSSVPERPLKDGSIVWNGLFVDITDRQHLERRVIQSEKMAAVGQLASGVAHEINNPLGVILGFAQTAAKHVSPGNLLEMPLRSIEREALRCKDLVQNLLAFSRAGKTEQEPCNLNEVVETALSLVAAQTKVKKVELVKKLHPCLPTVFANKTQLQQVVINLSNNAVDAMPNGGRLTILTQWTVWDDKEAVEIQVQDTGAGIPKEIQPRIFEPFFTTKETSKGTGLGLALAYEIVEKHGGYMTVDSEPGKGSIFRVCLPVKEIGR